MLRGSVTYEGKRYYVSGYSHNEIKKKKDAKRAELESGKIANRKNVLVKDYAAEWLEGKKADVNPRHYNDLEGIIRNWILPEIGTMQMGKVTQPDVQRVVSGLRGKSDSLISKVKQVLKSMFTLAAARKDIAENPFYAIKNPKAAEKRQRRSITDEEREIILATARGFEGGTFYLVMLYAGLRPQEVAALLWEDIDFTKKEIHIRRTLKSDDTIAPYGKTSNSLRTVFLSDELAKALRKVYKKEAPDLSDWVVHKRRSRGHHTKTSMRSMWEAFRLAMHVEMGGKTDTMLRQYKDGKTGDEIPYSVSVAIDDKVASDLVPYCLRHTFCTDLKAAGVPVDVARDLMGHSTIALTAEIYSHAEYRSRDDARIRINKLNKERKNN